MRLTEALIQNARVLAESLRAKAIVLDSEISETHQSVSEPSLSCPATFGCRNKMIGE